MVKGQDQKQRDKLKGYHRNPGGNSYCLGSDGNREVVRSDGILDGLKM